MKIIFPIPPFYMKVLGANNVEPSQLFPNSWGYIKAFEMVCEDLVIIPTMRVLSSF